MKSRFILNPTSGHNRRRPGLADDLRRFIVTHGLHADLVITEGPGHATALAQAAVDAGCQQVVAVGGDGTLNEVAQALLHTPVALALVPCGSGNGLALHLGLPTSLPAALALIAGVGPPTRVAAIDTGSVNGRPFFNAMGLGLDAEVSRRFNALTRRGLPAYSRTVFATLRAARPESITVCHDDHRQRLDVLLLAVANSDQYGNHARIAPGARVDDGRLDLVAVLPTGPLGAIGLAARLFHGSLLASPRVRHLRRREFRIERAAPGLVHTDGETHLLSPTLEIAVHPRSLRLLLPATSSSVAPVDDAAPAGFAFAPP